MKNQYSSASKSLGIMFASLAAAALSSSASASTIIGTNVETQATHQWSGPTVTMNATTLTTLGSTDWAIFGWDGTNSVHVNSKSGASNISVASVNLDGADRIGGRGSILTNWTYADGVSPASASGQNLGGLGAGMAGGTNRAISFTVDLTGLTTGTLSVWYAGVEGMENLSATVGAATATSQVNEGFNTVRYRRVDLDFSNTGDNTLTVRIDNDAQYSWTSSTFLYAASLSAVPEPSSCILILGGLGLVMTRRRPRPLSRR